MFIDDLLGDTSAPEEHLVVGRLAAGAADLKVTIEADLGCKVAEHKSILVASSDRLLKRLGEAFGKYRGKTAESGANLGVDYAPGLRRALKKSLTLLRKRAGGFSKRLRRLRA